ncbi:hypothetical protein ACFYTQ_23805 [Nocardia sp. NPDC004068]|uniref:hypothetical protein n=1 Tax=Nocardia sp. NPDC004068 TaxID=3364303 RepID=UPI00369E7283
MNELRNLIALQARVYEFLEQQDEATLRAILAGTARLTVVGATDAPIARPRPTPSSDPVQAAQDISRLTSEHDRKIYLNAAGFKVDDLHRVARACGLRGYSGLKKAALIDLLSVPDTHDRHVAAAAPPEPAVFEPGPERAGRPETSTAATAVDATAIAERLRELESEQEGAAYLRDQRLDRESLLALAAELQLTRVGRLSQSELEKRVLKQAIGARRKFSGLRKW